MHSKYLNLVNFSQNLIPNSVQTYINPSLILTTQNKLFYFGYQKIQQNTQTKKKFTFKSTKQQITQQKANFYDISTNQWYKEQIKGKIPSLRQNYLMIVFQNNILLYGGKSGTNKQLNDIHAFSIQRLNWKKLFSIQGPLISQNNLLIKLTQTKIMLINNQVWTFELKNIKWQLNSNELPGGIWQNKGITLNNLNFTKLVNATVIQELVFIFYFNQTQLKCSLLDFDHKQFRQVPISAKIKKQKISKCSSLIKMKGNIKNQYTMLLNQQLILFQIINLNNQYKAQIKDKLPLQKDFIQKNQCICLTQTHFYAIINRKIISYQLKINREKQNSQNSSQKKINKKIANDTQSIQKQQKQLIQKQSNQQKSLVIQKKSQNWSNPAIRNSNLILQDPEQLIEKNIIYKRSSQEQNNYIQQEQNNYSNSQNDLIIGQNNQIIDQQIIKQKIQPLLAYQHLKRKELEQKGRLLQKQIKQSQKFVLSLISYSQESEKAKHISKMKQLRQQLQILWTKQIFFRKQIQNQQKKIAMQKLIKRLN